MAAPVRLSFLGGLGRIGRNCSVIESEGSLLMIDCGQMFPDDATPGIEAILPDFTLLRDRADDVVGCIVTHAHEDHIGALPYLLRDLPHLHIFGTAFTLGLVQGKLREAGVLKKATLVPLADGEHRQIGPFACEFLPVTHSTPSGVISVITTPQGVILHSSDFKLDEHPIDGRLTDMARLRELGHHPGVRLLLADSTNADTPGFTRSESTVGPVLAGVFAANKGRRIIVASFASHIHRLQQVVNIATAEGRTIVPLGLSMVRNIKMARDLGLFHVPDPSIADAEDLHDLDPATVCVICTGSQGEPRAALAQMVSGESRFLTLDRNDTVIFSSHPIPGNEAAVARLRNGLARLGAEVVHSGQLEVHTSGHAKQGELVELWKATRPEWLIPVHGEYAHLLAHARLIAEEGMRADRIALCEDGDTVLLTDAGIVRSDPAPGGGGDIYVDGNVGGIDKATIDQRLTLGQGGFVAVVVDVDLAGRRVFGRAEVTSRGWAGEGERDSLEERVAKAVNDALAAALSTEAPTSETVERAVRRAAGSTVAEVSRRRPMIVPVVRLH